jgi:hypothetical protein
MALQETSGFGSLSLREEKATRAKAQQVGNIADECARFRGQGADCWEGDH